MLDVYGAGNPERQANKPKRQTSSRDLGFVYPPTQLKIITPAVTPRRGAVKQVMAKYLNTWSIGTRRTSWIYFVIQNYKPETTKYKLEIASTMNMKEPLQISLVN